MVLSVAKGWLDKWRIVSLPGLISAFLWEDRSGPGHMTSAGLFRQEDCHWLAVIAGGRHFDCQVPGDLLRFLRFPPLLRGIRLRFAVFCLFFLLSSWFCVVNLTFFELQMAWGSCRFLLARRFVRGLYRVAWKVLGVEIILAVGIHLSLIRRRNWDGKSEWIAC